MNRRSSWRVPVEVGNLPVFLCFRHSLMLFVATPGQPNANRGFSVFSKKLFFVELGLKFQESVAEFKDLRLRFEDLGGGISRFGVEI